MTITLQASPDPFGGKVRSNFLPCRVPSYALESLVVPNRTRLAGDMIASVNENSRPLILGGIMQAAGVCEDLRYCVLGCPCNSAVEDVGEYFVSWTLSKSGKGMT